MDKLIEGHDATLNWSQLSKDVSFVLWKQDYGQRICKKCIFILDNQLCTENHKSQNMSDTWAVIHWLLSSQCCIDSYFHWLTFKK